MNLAIVVAGLGFGDEGKGTTVDYVVRQHKAHTVVRYNGGAQAAHNVVLDDGRHHTFAQFGSGTFAGARTFLSRHMLVNPLALLAEARHLVELGISQPMGLIDVDREAVVTTPFHMAVNRLRELSRGDRHGSCGMGVGETARLAETGYPELALRMEDLANTTTLLEKLNAIRGFLRVEADELKGVASMPLVEEQYRFLEDPTVLDDCVEMFQSVGRSVNIVNGGYLDKLLAKGTTVFEGAQGVLLDRQYGFFPYVTRSHTTFKNALDLLADFNGQVLKLGVLRSYATRHGAGPFVTESPELALSEEFNRSDDPWQQNFRVGYFDFVMGRYAVEVCGGVDEIVMTHMDRLPAQPKICPSYSIGAGVEAVRIHPHGRETEDKITRALFKAKPIYEVVGSRGAFLEAVESELKAPITLLSYGPKPSDKKARSTISNAA